MKTWDLIRDKLKDLRPGLYLDVASFCGLKITEMARRLYKPSQEDSVLSLGVIFFNHLRTACVDEEEINTLRAACEAYDAENLNEADFDISTLPGWPSGCYINLITDAAAVIWSACDLATHRVYSKLSELVEAYLDAFYQPSCELTSGLANDRYADDAILENSEPLKSALMELSDFIDQLNLHRKGSGVDS